MSFGNKLLQAGVLIGLAAGAASGGDLPPSDHHQAGIVDHRLTVELNPAAHQLVARDETTVDLPAHATTITFTLAPSLQVESIVLPPGAGASPEQLSFTTEQLTQPPTQRVTVTLPAAGERRATLIWTYRGLIHDPPKEPRHLRFVTPSETAGHIGPEGVYLSSESQWYPDLEGSFSSFQVTAKVPREWTVVTQGIMRQETVQDESRVSIWHVRERSEALTLVANVFVTKTREWKGANGQHVQLATFFFPDNAALADEYLTATANYLDVYVPLLGDYPFEKFAVVENFFASGLGMPSFTLLGSGSIKRHYVQPYALGHEIVHSWIGNSVFNRADRGNWVEGLTTYLANYLWHEITHDAQQAREQRRLMMQGYSLYVSPEREYPVADFMHKHDEQDNAIGYQKAAFMFHLLRQEIGDDSFWRGLKTLVSRFRNRPADWGHLEQVFAQASGRDLRWFFAQWVEQPGAPQLSLGEVRASRRAGAEAAEQWRMTLQVTQAGKPFRLAVPVRILTKEGADTQWMTLSRAKETVDLLVSAQPLRVQLDPDLMSFRRVARPELPPMLNLYVTDTQRTVVQAFSESASPLQQVVARIAGQEAEMPQEHQTRMAPLDKTTMPATGSVLVLAGADQRTGVQSMVRESCGDRVTLQEGGFQVDGRTYEGPLWAVLVSCHRASVPGSVITVLYSVTPQAVAKVSRLLFYYGWQSVVVFHEGAVDRREVWESGPDMKEVHINATQ
jgi:aminopeptidase N